MRDPYKIDAELTGSLLKQAVHTVESLAAHVLPKYDHIGIELFNELPEIVKQYPVAAMCTVTHDHSFGELCYIIYRLLTVFGCIHLGDHICVVH